MFLSTNGAEHGALYSKSHEHARPLDGLEQAISNMFVESDLYEQTSQKKVRVKMNAKCS